MRYCKACDESYENNGKFCASCGGRLIDPVLIAILPQEHKNHENIKSLVEWDLVKFSFEVIQENMSISTSQLENFMDGFNGHDLANAFESGDFDEFERLVAKRESDGSIARHREKLTKEILRALKFVKQRMWMFEAADHLLKEGGREGVDLKRLAFGGVDLRELNADIPNADLLDKIYESYNGINDYMTGVSDFASEVSKLVDQLE